MAGIDVFAALPDSLLVQILSYLPTKEAVRAQLISKRWKNLWADLPVLDFDFADYWSEDIFGGDEYQIYVWDNFECHENFVRVIDDVLASRQIQQIDRFKLVWQYQVRSYDVHPVRRWILVVLQQSLRVLFIYVQPSVDDVEVPDAAFACSTLEEMTLQIDNREPEVLGPLSVNLPRLRKLNLGYYTITADFMSKLLPGCPSLEELELYACRLNLSHISCNSLKSLVINGSCNSMDIHVSIPSLQYLKVTVMSCQIACIVFKNMSSLIKACVCFLTADGFGRSFYNSEANVLNCFSGVTNLEVVLHGSEAGAMLRHALTNCPYFENLKVLHFENFDSHLVNCMDVIDLLLIHSPTLEDMTFCGCKNESDEIELLEELRVVCEHGNCRLVECKEGCIYDSLDKLMKELNVYLMRFEKMEWEVADEEAEEAW